VWTDKDISETALRIVSQKDVKSPVSETLKQKENPFDFVGKFKNRYTLNLTDKDMSKFKTLYSNPWDIARDNPEFGNLINIEMTREETGSRSSINSFPIPSRVENRGFTNLSTCRTSRLKIFFRS